MPTASFSASSRSASSCNQSLGTRCLKQTEAHKANAISIYKRTKIPFEQVTVVSKIESFPEKNCKRNNNSFLLKPALGRAIRMKQSNECQNESKKMRSMEIGKKEDLSPITRNGTSPMDTYWQHWIRQNDYSSICLGPGARLNDMECFQPWKVLVRRTGQNVAGKARMIVRPRVECFFFYAYHYLHIYIITVWTDNKTSWNS